MLSKEAPSNAIARIASFKNVIGKILAIGCKKAGKVSILKKLPLSKNCGRVTRFAIGETASSLSPKDDTKSPSPKKTSKPSKDNSNILINVDRPFTRVKLNAKCPTKTITATCSAPNAILLITLASIIVHLGVGVANILFSTRVFLKVIITNAILKTPDDKSEKLS